MFVHITCICVIDRPAGLVCHSHHLVSMSYAPSGATHEHHVICHVVVHVVCNENDTIHCMRCVEEAPTFAASVGVKL